MLIGTRVYRAGQVLYRLVWHTIDASALCLELRAAAGLGLGGGDDLLEVRQRRVPRQRRRPSVVLSEGGPVDRGLDECEDVPHVTADVRVARRGVGRGADEDAAAAVAEAEAAQVGGVEAEEAESAREGKARL